VRFILRTVLLRGGWGLRWEVLGSMMGLLSECFSLGFRPQIFLFSRKVRAFLLALINIAIGTSMACMLRTSLVSIQGSSPSLFSLRDLLTLF
jgi:hypothetical protein